MMKSNFFPSIKWQEVFENNRQDITVAMMKSYPLLLRKFISDKAKVSSMVEIVLYMNLELYSLKRQEQVSELFFVGCLTLFTLFLKSN